MDHIDAIASMLTEDPDILNEIHGYGYSDKETAGGTVLPTRHEVVRGPKTTVTKVDPKIDTLKIKFPKTYELIDSPVGALIAQHDNRFKTELTKLEQILKASETGMRIDDRKAAEHVFKLIRYFAGANAANRAMRSIAGRRVSKDAKHGLKTRQD